MPSMYTRCEMCGRRPSRSPPATSWSMSGSPRTRLTARCASRPERFRNPPTPEFVPKRRRGICANSASGGPHDAAQPFHRLGDAVLDADLRLPAQQAARLLDAGPAAHDVDGEARQVLEGELVAVAPARAPDDLGELGERPLVGGAD